MTPKQTTINTVTLTCSTCGSAQFTKLDTNEYQCSHCHAVTLVEDNVAQRLEKILRGMQQPAPAAKLQPGAIIAIVLVVLAAILVPLTATLFNSGSSTRSPSRAAPPPIDATLVKLTDVQEVRARGRNQLVMLMRNETGKKIDAPRVTATFYQGELTLSSTSGSPMARTLLPGEYTPVTVMLYGEDGKLIGTGNGYGSASPLAPGALTSFDVRCDMLAEGKVGSYDYMVQSEG